MSDGRLGVSVTVTIAGGVAAAALSVAMTRAVAARRGRKAGIHLDDASGVRAAVAIDTLVLDGLSPLVDGKQVMAVDPVEPDHLRNLRWFAGALEHHADDPVARALARLAPRGNVTSVEHHPGQGISGAVDRHPVRVGTAEWLGSPDGGDAPDPLVDRLSVEVDGRIIGTIDVADHVRDDAAAAVGELSAQRITPVLAAGGACARARAVADQVGVERVECSAAADVVATLLSDEQRVAVVARTGATTAVGFDGTLILADKTAGRRSPSIGLAVADLAHAADAIRRARRLLAVTDRNRALSWAYAALATLAAAAGLLPPLLATAVAVIGVALATGFALRR